MRGIWLRAYWVSNRAVGLDNRFGKDLWPCNDHGFLGELVRRSAWLVEAFRCSWSLLCSLGGRLGTESRALTREGLRRIFLGHS